jgi:hypothetical protein
MITRIPRRLRAVLDTPERGIALPVVFGLGIVMLMLVAGSMSVALGSLYKTNTDENSSAALAAAFAGVEEYQSRLANDATYYKYGNPAAVFSQADTANGKAASTLTLPTGTQANAAFDVGSSGGWATVPGSSGRASFRYEVDNSTYPTTGVIIIRSTGRVGDSTQSIVANLKQSGFINFLYFTDYELQDPLLSGVNVASCVRYAYGSNARNASSCGIIQFGQFDVINGPLHSNDKLFICKSTFNGAVTTSSTSSPIYDNRGCGSPTFAVGTGPTFAKILEMPPTNSDMKKETRIDLSADVPRPGCLYTGPTWIRYEIVGGVPKMRVISPWTKITNPSYTGGIASTSLAQCGTPGTGANGLGSVTGALIDVLALNLVFVQAVPAIGSGDPNAPANSSMPSALFSCIGSGLTAGWSFASTTPSALSFPLAGEAAPWGASSGNPAYNCRGGDAYVSGVVGGQTTLAAENYVYLVGNLTYDNASTDIMGIVGQNGVFVWNPIKASNSANMLTDTNRTVSAAILSVGHTFGVQNFNRGTARGTLNIIGAIAQKFRGTVATASGNTVVTGYSKNYTYDERFVATAPPKFLTPISTSYGVTQYATVAAAFAADGSTP